MNDEMMWIVAALFVKCADERQAAGPSWTRCD